MLKRKQLRKYYTPYTSKTYLEECAAKLADDECYPEEVMNEFKLFVGNLNDVLYTYGIIKDVIESFNGDAEKFYPLFYKGISDVEKPSSNPLSRKSSLLLGFEVANNVLCHSSGSSFKDSVLVLLKILMCLLIKRNLLYVNLVVMFLVHFIAEYDFLKHRVIFTINNIYHCFLLVK